LTDSERTAVKLELQAGCCILKLTKRPVFADMMSYKYLHVLASLIMVSICSRLTALWRYINFVLLLLLLLLLLC